MALGINMLQTLIPLIMVPNEFSCHFFSHWNLWDIVWIKLKVMGSKLPSVIKIFCRWRIGYAAIQSILPCFFQVVVKTHLNKLTWNQKLSHNMALGRKKARAEGLRHHSGDAIVCLVCVLFAHAASRRFHGQDFALHLLRFTACSLWEMRCNLCFKLYSFVRDEPYSLNVCLPPVLWCQAVSSGVLVFCGQWSMQGNQGTPALVPGCVFIWLL